MLCESTHRRKSCTLLKADLCALPRWGSLEARRSTGENLCCLHGTTHCWCPLLPWAPYVPLPAEGQEQILLAYESSDLVRPLFLRRQIAPKEHFLSTEDKGRVDILDTYLEQTSALFAIEDLQKTPKNPYRQLHLV